MGLGVGIDGMGGIGVRVVNDWSTVKGLCVGVDGVDGGIIHNEYLSVDGEESRMVIGCGAMGDGTAR